MYLFVDVWFELKQGGITLILDENIHTDLYLLFVNRFSLRMIYERSILFFIVENI